MKIFQPSVLGATAPDGATPAWLTGAWPAAPLPRFTVDFDDDGGGDASAGEDEAPAPREDHDIEIEDEFDDDEVDHED